MIYYVDQSGSVIGGTDSNDLNAITALPHSASYAVFIDDVTVATAINGETEGTLQIQDLTSGEPNVYGLPTATGTLVFTPTPDSVKLANALQAKITELEQKYLESVQTFQSSALSSTRTDQATWTYLSGVTDMILMGNEYSFVIGPDYDNNPVPWYTVEDGKNVPHTAEQFRQVWKDGRTWIQNQDTHKQALVAQAQEVASQSGATVDQINAISW